MGEPYLGEIFLGGWNFAPQNFSFCNGQIKAISQNTALFSLLGTTYGGNGFNNFALPDLRSRVPMHWGQQPGLSAYSIGQSGGQETVQLNTNQIPVHNHIINATDGAPDSTNPNGAYFSSGPFIGTGPISTELKVYNTSAPNGLQFAAGTIANTGGGNSHTNIQPYLCVTFVIALTGIFPARN
jgi:microcystin-dependent protein